ncbi:MAG: type II CAAX endopeptidase family protein [Ignavibacteriales bacterium]|nr:type II CAAX endopeptidase family protein [Ignavibacteriales bacterium]
MKQTMTWFTRTWIILWKTGLFFVLWGLLLAPFVIPFGARFEQLQQTSALQLRMYLEAAGVSTILAVAWFMTHFIDRRSFLSLGFSPDRWIRDLLAGLGIGAAWLTLSLVVMWISGSLQVQRGADISVSVLAWSAAGLLLNTVTQEVLVRSYIFQTIRSQTNVTAAIIASAVLFMAYHAGAYHGTWLPAFNVFAAGILFALAYQLTGNLWLPIGIHFIWNFLIDPVLGLSVSGTTQLKERWQLVTLQGSAWLTGGAFGLEGGLAVTVTTWLGILMLFVLLRRQTAAKHTASGRS